MIFYESIRTAIRLLLTKFCKENDMKCDRNQLKLVCPFDEWRPCRECSYRIIAGFFHSFLIFLFFQNELNSIFGFAVKFKKICIDHAHAHKCCVDIFCFDLFYDMGSLASYDVGSCIQMLCLMVFICFFSLIRLIFLGTTCFFFVFF